MQLNQSPVTFNDNSHSYRLGDKKLLGITGLIHSVLGLGVYPEASEFVVDNLIPRAGSRGTAVHRAIQTLDELGVLAPVQTVRTRYGCRERDNIRYVDEEWDVSIELDSYIRHRKGFTPIANEYTVSDNDKYASQIDNVWRYDSTGGIWLIDTKTNNVDLYPLCGYFVSDYFKSGVAALCEYLSWQLSIYAELFEFQNPGLKVEGLACNWLRSDDAAFWLIDRKPSELVWELLSSDYVITDNGPVYFHNDPTVFGIGVSDKTPATKDDLTPIVPPDVIDYFDSLLRNYKELERKLEEAKKSLRAAMEQHEVKSFDFGPFKATLASDSVVQSFDSKKFKADNPELYKQYLVSKTRKGGLVLKQKE